MKKNSSRTYILVMNNEDDDTVYTNVNDFLNSSCEILYTRINNITNDYYAAASIVNKLLSFNNIVELLYLVDNYKQVSNLFIWSHHLLIDTWKNNYTAVYKPHKQKGTPFNVFFTGHSVDNNYIFYSKKYNEIFTYSNKHLTPINTNFFRTNNFYKRLNNNCYQHLQALNQYLIVDHLNDKQREVIAKEIFFNTLSYFSAMKCNTPEYRLVHQFLRDVNRRINLKKYFITIKSRSHCVNSKDTNENREYIFTTFMTMVDKLTTYRNSK